MSTRAELAWFGEGRGANDLLEGGAAAAQLALLGAEDATGGGFQLLPKHALCLNAEGHVP